MRKSSFKLFKSNRRIRFEILFILLLVIVVHKNTDISSVCNGFFSDIRFAVFEVYDKCNSYWINIKQNFSQDVGEQIFNLKCENIELKVKADRVDSVIAENNRLKSLLNIKNSENREVVLAKIIDIFNNDFVRSALINVGKNQGVRLDDFAYCEEGIVGRIIDVSDNWSKVLFIVDTNSNIPAKISGMNVILSGDNSDLLRVNLLKSEVKEGDIAESSSYGEVFQEHIKIGTVIKNNDEFFVKPFVNFHDLKYVCIGRCLD